MTYEAFLVALFAIAAGCSILETSANPYVMSLGPEETATRRLNFAQAFNPVGTNIGVLLAATLILPKLDEPVNMADVTPAQETTIRAGQLGAVMGPYLGLGFVLIAIGLVIAIKKSPPIVEEFPDADMEGQSPLKILLSNKRYVFGVIAQFFNVAAQVCTWTYLIQYSQQALDGSLAAGRLSPAGQPDRVPHLPVLHDVAHRAASAPTKVLAVLALLAVCSVCSRCSRRTWPGWPPSSRCPSACP